MEKPRGYHDEWSAFGGAKAKTRGATSPKGFWPPDLPRHFIHHGTPNDFPYNVILLAFWTSEEGFLSVNGLPREYHGQYLSFAGQTLVKLNPNIIVREVERFLIVTVIEPIVTVIEPIVTVIEPIVTDHRWVAGV